MYGTIVLVICVIVGIIVAAVTISSVIDTRRRYYNDFMKRRGHS
ncbi:MAG: hypothetical protein AB1473_00845 [Thermodesulfobacteriota bacterium]